MVNCEAGRADPVYHRQVKIVNMHGCFTFSILLIFRKNTLFDDYKIESNSANEIWLEINLDSLLKALRSADSSSQYFVVRRMHYRY